MKNAPRSHTRWCNCSVSLTRIGHLGWALFAVWSAVLVVWGIVDPDPYASGWRLVVELAFLGRLVNIADGTAAGFSNVYLLIQSGVQDIRPVAGVLPGCYRGTRGLR